MTSVSFTGLAIMMAGTTALVIRGLRSISCRRLLKKVVEGNIASSLWITRQ